MMSSNLSSNQETVLEELMQKSFGAQNLYIPNNYLRGYAEKEPCDLMWFGNGVLVLFYLTSGNASIDKQDKHNLRQARQWMRYWTRVPSHCLQASNRFGDLISIQYKDVSRLVCVSIVSHSVGIVFHEDAFTEGFGFTCTVPESLIHDISEFNGTVIDFLAITQKFSTNFRRHITKHSIRAIERLKLIINQVHVSAAEVLKRLPERESNVETDDFEFVYNIINLLRLTAPQGNKLIASPEGREDTAKFFSDMSSLEYLSLAVTCINVINATDGVKVSRAGYTKGLYLDWGVIAASISSSNFNTWCKTSLENFERIGMKNSPVIIYGMSLPGAEYRVPIMHMMPKNKTSIQAQDLIDQVIKRLASISISNS